MTIDSAKPKNKKQYYNILAHNGLIITAKCCAKKHEHSCNITNSKFKDSVNIIIKANSESSALDEARNTINREYFFVDDIDALVGSITSYKG